MDEYTTKYVIDNFLYKHFPKKRIRDGTRFKWGYVLEKKFTGQTNMYLFEKKHKKIILKEMIDIIFFVFGFNKKECEHIAKYYLQ